MKERDRIDKLIGAMTPAERGALERIRRSSIKLLINDLDAAADLEALQAVRLVKIIERPRAGGRVVELTPYGRAVADRILGIEAPMSDFLEKEVSDSGIEALEEFVARGQKVQEAIDEALEEVDLEGGEAADDTEE